jgi:hypothetical protein
MKGGLTKHDLATTADGSGLSKDQQLLGKLFTRRTDVSRLTGFSEASGAKRMAKGKSPFTISGVSLARLPMTDHTLASPTNCTRDMLIGSALRFNRV